MVRVKICGITNLADAEAAAGFGADAIGFIFYKKSPRAVTTQKAALLSAAMGPLVTRVGVFVDETPARIVEIARKVRLDAVQLHGRESAKTALSLKDLRIIKVFHVDGETHDFVPGYPADAYLFDTTIGQRSGGTGRRFDWNIFRSFSFNRPLILSGGLMPENVAEAVRKIRPYAVDVSSGVEKKPGLKDHQKLREFIKNAKKV